MAAFQAPGLIFRGAFQVGAAYGHDDVVTYSGGLWRCAAPQTSSAPADGADWSFLGLALLPKAMRPCAPDDSLVVWTLPETPANLDSVTLYVNGLAQTPGEDADFVFGADGGSAVFPNPLTPQDRVCASYFVLG
jgi:hypothetical protein